MKRLLTAYYNKEDQNYYQVYRAKQNAGINDWMGYKLELLENNVKTLSEEKKLNQNNLQKTSIDMVTYLNLGDVIFINNSEYICLYYDKSSTILFNRYCKDDIEGLHRIPSKKQYLKINTASIEELKFIYGQFLLYKGLLHSRYLELIDGEMKRLLDK